MSLCDDVDFEMIASLTEYFSGADLQALLYTAHIEALHEVQYTSASKIVYKKKFIHLCLIFCF